MVITNAREPLSVVFLGAVERSRSVYRTDLRERTKRLCRLNISNGKITIATLLGNSYEPTRDQLSKVLTAR